MPVAKNFWLSGDAAGGDEVLDDAEDALLLMTGELADFLEDAACFADGPPFCFPPFSCPSR
jgi:hypothetical protein